MRKKICSECDTEFETLNGMKKTCSKVCAALKNKRRTKERYQQEKNKNRSTATCKFCQKEFTFHIRKNRDRNFCNRSCASKFYISNGTFDKWKLRKNDCRGIITTCSSVDCCNFIYVPPRLIKKEIRHVCSLLCKKKYMSSIFKGKKNPMYGKKLSKKSLLLQKQTLQKNHPGVNNAFELAIHRIRTRPQVKLFEHLKKEYPNFDFNDEVLVKINKRSRKYVDILSEKFKLIFELYGSYWHCDPRIYSEDFYVTKKKMTAKEIWKLDRSRVYELEKKGYTVKVIWELDMKNDEWKKIVKKTIEQHNLIYKEI